MQPINLRPAPAPADLPTPLTGAGKGWRIPGTPQTLCSHNLKPPQHGHPSPNTSGCPGASLSPPHCVTPLARSSREQPGLSRERRWGSPRGKPEPLGHSHGQRGLGHTQKPEGDPKATTLRHCEESPSSPQGGSGTTQVSRSIPKFGSTAISSCESHPGLSADTEIHGYPRVGCVITDRLCNQGYI